MSTFVCKMDRDSFESGKSNFPFLHMEYHDELTVGEFVMRAIYTHTIMEMPGLGIFAQTYGFLMGTNLAPVWVTLILRASEKRSPLPPHMKFFRFIDDGIALHFSENVDEFATRLKVMYPKDLKYEFEVVNWSSWILYMDCSFVSL